MPELDMLTLVAAHRQGGGGATAVDYLDFHVSGVSLLQRLGWSNANHIGCLGSGVTEYYAQLIQQLLLRQPSTLASGRHMLYVCPECGDIGCGAITAVISKEPEAFVWRDFGYENNYDDTIHHLADFAAIGPFRFDPANYCQAFNLEDCLNKQTVASSRHAISEPQNVRN